MKDHNTPTIILLKKVVHRKEEQLLLLFPYNRHLKEKIQKLGDYYWSKTLKGWYTKFTPDNILTLKIILKNDVKFRLDESIFKKNEANLVRKKREITSNKKHILQLYVKFLNSKHYTENTVKTYYTFIADFFEYLKGKPIININNTVIEGFIKDNIIPKKDNPDNVEEFICAIKLFSTFYPECNIDILKLANPQRN